MKKIIFYFNPKVTKIFVQKENGEGEIKMVLSSPYNFVGRSEIVARVIEIDDDEQIPARLDPGYEYYKVAKFIPIKADEGIFYDQVDGAYKASDYGFVIFINGKIRLLTQRNITRDKLKAYYTIYPTKFNKIPSGEDIEEYIHNFQILAGVGRKKIEEQLLKIDVNNNSLSRILVARGKPPVNGYEEYFIPLTDLEKKAGEIQSDGSMDFKEVGSIIQVVKGQEILEGVPAVQKVDGMDIFGNIIPATIENKKGYKRGEGIVQSGKDANIFVSAIDGCVKIIKNKVSVHPVAVINGDVNYETGNIDFNGSVEVRGSVLPGFKIRADNDVTIENTIEDAVIEAGGNVTVKMGVVGKESVMIKAGGKVIAKYLLNATVEAVQEVIVSDSIINCNIFSNNRVSVIERQGKIIGGNTIAFYEIEAKVVGAPNETGTQLGVGRNLFIERELTQLKKELIAVSEEVKETMRQLTVNFGETILTNPKELLTILPDIKKKKCLLLLRELSESNNKMAELNSSIQETQSKITLEREPCIIVKDTVYPGTVLNIKKSVRKIEKEMSNAKFYEDPDEKVIRFVSAT